MTNQKFLAHIPTKENIISAAKTVADYAHKTPILTSKFINSLTGCEVFFKCENFQRAGAFKFRGATVAVSHLGKNVSAVATHSSGNHAGALALAANENNISAHIVMPENAPKIKVNAVKSYGAKIYFCEPTQEAREAKLEEVVNKTEAVFVHPYNNYSVIAGQATAAYELLNETENPDYIFTPVGGGGLCSGTCLTAKYFSPDTKVIGGEPLAADDAFRSLRDGKIYPSVSPKTIADGLKTSLGKKTFEILSDNLSEIITVTEEEIVDAMRIFYERLKIVIEPSSAVPLAALIKKMTGLLIPE